MNKEQLISCLCVSYNRPNYLRKAIRCFATQTHEAKELIIVSKEFSLDYEKIISSPEFSELDIKYFHGFGNEVTLGELRNISIEKANGEFICIWDDDDWHHSERLERQLDMTMSRQKNGSILVYCLLYDATKEEAYLSCPMLHPATILCRKNLVNDTTRYPSLNREEDTFFFNELNKRNALVPFIDPSLYIYVCHGKNSWDEEHFNKIFRKSERLTNENRDLVRRIMNHDDSGTEFLSLLSSPSFLSELNYLGPYVFEGKK